MLASIFVTITIIAALGFGLRSERGDGELISRRPYNNRHNDASGARDYHFS
jgi:hypothetical protein